MTCFWDGILSALSPDFKSRNQISNPHSLVSFFKKVESKTNLSRRGEHPALLHQGSPLSDQQVKEFLQWIRDYDASGIRNGHLTSTCDPFLSVLAGYCDCSVEHLYNKKHLVRYESPFNHAKLWLRFASDRGHFWFVKREHRP